MKSGAWNIYMTKNEDSLIKKRQRNIVNYLSHSTFVGFLASVALTTTEQAIHCMQV